ncbi:MAG: UDP-N-acetylmuramoyl-L-alanyl-D-glutamate--2,6-diaminopimelate ligase [Alphaproteobacteria bacterium]|nr:UDP-N-acetylmuramoyl-L-alanyl-D-glutamate--2,6-diaminopimelate ligase [Alphaproteobacteria bacterium]
MAQFLTFADDWHRVKQDIAGVTDDSRQVQSGYVFAMLPSAVVGDAVTNMRHGREYIKQAIQQGASYLLAEANLADDLSTDLPIFISDNVRRDYALMAADFYASSVQDRLPKQMIAVTGTNGKSSIVWMLRHLWAYAGIKGASIGTHGIYQGLSEAFMSAGNLTTPNTATLAKTIGDLAHDGVQHLAMEASSHGLHQSRLVGFAVDIAIFTNLSQDHLDYHQDFEAYRQAKYLLFRDNLKAGGVALICADYDRIDELHAIAKQKQARFYSYGFSENCDFALLNCDYVDGFLNATLKLQKESVQIETDLVGKFQWENLLASCAAAYLSGMDSDAISPAIPSVKPVAGRLELVVSAHDRQVFVDYAHTPDALYHALKTLRDHQQLMAGEDKRQGQLYCLFGCGGERDKGKRALMAKIAAQHADRVIITDDNPRHEDPLDIRMEILKHCDGLDMPLHIPSRRRAIHSAINMLQSGDILLIAGKGSEDYQLIGDVKYPFDDREQAKKAWQKRLKSLVLWDKDRLQKADKSIVFKSNRDSLNIDTAGGMGGIRKGVGSVLTPEKRIRAPHINNAPLIINPPHINNPPLIINPPHINNAPHIHGIIINSQQARYGDLFIALKDKRDGHDFIESAKQNGAVAALGTKPPADIIAPDSLQVLENMARYQREHSKAIHIGVTGSVGKTSVKNGLARLFMAHGNCHSAQGSFNNHIGLPLSLATMPCDTDIGVFELGMNHAGEIDALSKILKPDIALITSIAPVHLAHFNDLSGVARAKSEIFAGMKENMKAGNIAILPLDSEFYDLLYHQAQCHDLRVLNFGTDESADVRIIGKQMQADNITAWQFAYQGETYTINGFVHGVQWGQLLAAMIAVQIAVAMMQEETIDKQMLTTKLVPLSGMHASNGRGNILFANNDGGYLVIDETYNASPLATQAALINLAEYHRDGRKVAVLGDMLELGKDEVTYHIDLLKFCADIDIVHVVGDRMKHLYDILPAQKQGICAQHADSLAQHLIPMLEKDDIIMVKGSAGMKMTKIITKIMES